MYHTSKYILDRSAWYTFKRLVVITAEVLIIAVIVWLIPNVEVTNYLTWILQAIIVAVISSIVVLTINCVIYKENVKNVIDTIKSILHKRKVAI